MVNQYDIAYAVGAAVAAPVWLVKASARRKVLTAIEQRMGHVAAREGTQPAVMIHAVSVGEINAGRELIRRLRAARGELHIILSTTTETGYARATELYGGDSGVTLIRFPLDFSWAVRRVLEALRPKAVVLMELEVWPNFMRQCERLNVPVIVVNGRLTESSFRRYRMIKALAGGMFRKIRRVCAQDKTYAERFAVLGTPRDRIAVTGTMKFDTAEVSDEVAGAGELAAAVGLKRPGELAWVCGSTGPGEEAILLQVYRSLQARFEQLRLVIDPRHPQRFNEVAGIIRGAAFECVRRSSATRSIAGDRPVILGDTMGELRGWYSLADLVFSGRSLVDLGSRQHGSDMIEPAALGKAVIVGPFTGNFAEPMEKFLAGDAIKVVDSVEALRSAAEALLADPAAAAELGARARQVVLAERGATDRHVKAILEFI